MTEKERQERIKQLLAELKELQATPQSDWHAGFEALLRIEMHKFGDKVSIRPEEVLGVGPPRADYLIVVDEGNVQFDKEIFKIFRKFNIVEFKRSDDALNERTLRKIIGYANFFIGIGDHESDVPPDQVTISIFRYAKNPQLFSKLQKKGYLSKDETPGIYRLTGMTDLPFQIVITSELHGEEYSAYRVLNEKPQETDIENVLKDSSGVTDDFQKTYYRVLLKLIARKNPEIFMELRKEYDGGVEVDIFFKDEVDNQVQEKVEEVSILHIQNLMHNLKLTVEQAMDALSIPQSQQETYAELIAKA